jgi:hypothetical protein
MKKKTTLLALLFLTINGFTQTQNVLNFLDDCTWYTEKFISPSTDAAVYISGANWMTTAKKRKLFSVNFSAHANLFFIPNQDRDFQIKSADFKFFAIKDLYGNTVQEATVPTVFGGEGKYKLVGQLGGQPLSLDTPIGISRESAPYPYFQTSISLWKGFELSAKFTPNLKYKELQYQVYGVGIKHNFSQYFKKIEAKKIYFSALLAISKEQVTSHYIDATTPFGTLGLNTITGKVKTYQLQLSVSKAWKNFELIASTINTSSDFEYVLTGERGTIEDIIPVQSILNDKLKSIYATKYNSIFELSGRYKMKNFYLQSSVTIGKFVNTGLALQYEFNTK